MITSPSSPSPWWHHHHHHHHDEITTIAITMITSPPSPSPWWHHHHRHHHDDLTTIAITMMQSPPSPSPWWKSPWSYPCIHTATMPLGIGSEMKVSLKACYHKNFQNMAVLCPRQVGFVIAHSCHISLLLLKVAVPFLTVLARSHLRAR